MIEKHFAPVFMEKDDNLELVERYEVVDYPAFVWTDASGKMVTRTVRPSDSAELIEEFEDALADMVGAPPADK